MNEVTLIANIYAKEGFGKQLFSMLAALVVESRRESGCISYDLHTDPDNSEHFVMYEVWKDEAILETHVQSIHFKSFVRDSESCLKSLDIAHLKKVNINK